jgi:hypothetical protein
VVYNVDSMIYPVVNLTEYPMTFHIADSSGRKLPEQDRIFHIYAKFFKFGIVMNDNHSPEVKREEINIYLERCDLNKHFGKYEKYFTGIPELSFKYCLPAESHNITLFGRYGDVNKEFGIPQIFVSRCINGTAGKENCFDNEVIDRILVSVFFEFSYIDYDIDHYNPNDPRILTKKADVVHMSSSVYSRIMKPITNVIYSSDYGYIFESNDVLKFFQGENLVMEYDFRKKEVSPGIIASFFLSNSNKSHIYTRVYIKLQSLLANIGGVINGFTIIIKIINYIFSRKLLNFILFESLFNNVNVSEKKRIRKKLDGILNKNNGILLNTKNQNNRQNEFESKDNINCNINNVFQIDPNPDFGK